MDFWIRAALSELFDVLKQRKQIAKWYPVLAKLLLALTHLQMTDESFKAFYERYLDERAGRV